MVDRRRVCSLLVCSWLVSALWFAGGEGARAQTAPERDWSRTLEQWEARCREIIAGLTRYPEPPRAGDAAPPAAGLALVKVDRHGKVVDVEIRKSSGVPELDRAVVEAAWKAGRLPKPPLVMAAAYPVMLMPIAFPER